MLNLTYRIVLSTGAERADLTIGPTGSLEVVVLDRAGRQHDRSFDPVHPAHLAHVQDEVFTFVAFTMTLGDAEQARLRDLLARLPL